MGAIMTNNAGFMSDITPLVMDELVRKSKNKLYRTDFQAWKWDILGLRTYDKMQGIMHDALFGEKNHVAVKSSNGTSKSFEASLAIMWNATVFDPGETLTIVSAPSLTQIERVIFGYLKQFYNIAYDRGHRPLGHINEQNEWKYTMPTGQKGLLAVGRRPPDHDVVSTFQGFRAMSGKTMIIIDEFGGVSEDLITAADAILTSAEGRFIGIGNPDRVNTFMHKVYTQDKYKDDWSLHTISAFDTPAFTGERVYPAGFEDKEQALLNGLVQPDWVEQRRRMWGEGSARWKSKVLGEFPDTDGDYVFFNSIKFHESRDVRYVPNDDTVIRLGCDISRLGSDDTCVVLYEGNPAKGEAKLQLIDKWGSSDLVTTAKRIHELAKQYGATEVRVDANGIGGGVFDNLNSPDLFPSRNYDLIGMVGSNASPDNTQWAQARTYYYDTLRQGLQLGLVQIDNAVTDESDDELLEEEILGVMYKFNSKQAIQIETKDEAKKRGLDSTNILDAMVYAYAKLDNSLSGVRELDGEVIDYDIEQDVAQYSPFYDYAW